MYLKQYEAFLLFPFKRTTKIQLGEQGGRQPSALDGTHTDDHRNEITNSASQLPIQDTHKSSR